MTENTTTGDGNTRGRREQRPAATGTAYTTAATGTSGSDITKGAVDPNRTTGPNDTMGATGSTHTTGPAHTAGPNDTMGATGSQDTRAPLVAGHEGEGTVEGRTEGLTEGRSGGRATGSAGHLLPHEETDKLSLRLQHAVGGFVDGPRTAVEEADQVLQEAASRFTDAINQRRRTLRSSWQTADEERASSSDTEQLRLALRDYRELTERLLRL
ncbi:hypothetical protein [Streptomyces neyagawaensis]|uniref:hypothetical protein n=1 Tax=Streptomyces neyagawaensis TaxID=42238 RepID=UPI0007C760C3|nr:hypothetical protein [Streptomyces neyagawaensis]MCL6732747.1 hypothetical protein [Streptomyces neyagawaensis]MDE1681483.1 hypothetical protein [Streptomyces neyagawaensis]